MNNGCEATRELIPELATGTVSGEERARALAHIAGCPNCRRELDETARVVDELLLLAPEREPPSGFESAILSRTSAPQPRRRTWLYAAAVVLTAVVAAASALWATWEDRSLGARYRATLEVANGDYFAASRLNAAGDGVGNLFAYEGATPWVFMTVDGADSGTYSVELVTEDGRRIDIGDCVVVDGRGAWGRSIEVEVHDILLVRLVKRGSPTLVARFDAGG
jgi:hypothetical protein